MNNKEFLNKLVELNTDYKEGNLEILETYQKMRQHLLVKNEFGLGKMTPENLLKNQPFRIVHALDKENYFVNQVNKYNPYVRSGELVLQEPYRDIRIPILVKDSYGLSYITASSLLKGGKPNIKTAVDKHSYFMAMLRRNNPSFFKEGFKIVSKYKANHSNIEAEDKYGIYVTTPNSLLKKSNPTIQVAKDKTINFINRAKEVHGDKYDYSEVTYTDVRNKIKIICSNHGLFNQNPCNHLKGQGCFRCQKKVGIGSLKHWKEMGGISLDFTGYCFYILELHNKELKENFFKVGRTYVDVDYRLGKIPYKGKVIYTIEGSAEDIFNLEKAVISHHKDIIKNSYTPNIYFKGAAECFKFIDYNFIENETETI